MLRKPLPCGILGKLLRREETPPPTQSGCWGDPWELKNGGDKGRVWSLKQQPICVTARLSGTENSELSVGVDGIMGALGEWA